MMTIWRRRRGGLTQSLRQCAAPHRFAPAPPRAAALRRPHVSAGRARARAPGSAPPLRGRCPPGSGRSSCLGGGDACGARRAWAHARTHAGAPRRAARRGRRGFGGFRAGLAPFPRPPSDPSSRRAWDGHQAHHGHLVEEGRHRQPHRARDGRARRLPARGAQRQQLLHAVRACGGASTRARRAAAPRLHALLIACTHAWSARWQGRASAGGAQRAAGRGQLNQGARTRRQLVDYGAQPH